MKCGGENRPRYLRARHLDRVAAELEVKPTLVRQRVSRIIERVKSSAESARSEPPAYFQERPALDSIETTVEERCQRLMQAAGEAS